ncbi:MAG: hypothetical protein A2044_01675 [Candidatus Firestonebacteria bacterium GWA2_43_8]|nr:MAG: hypothetical protein A2044_01675 [Candidatus Firestonebacteria bacterium GWA2_43_8]
MLTKIKIKNKISRDWAIFTLTVKKFLKLNGGQWAGSFAFDLFFSIFPLIVLFVTIASFFIDPVVAGKEIIVYMQRYVPIRGEMQDQIFNTLSGVVKARSHVGVISFFILAWGAIQCFSTLIFAANLAWGTPVRKWWRLPLKSFLMLGVTAGMVLLGMVAPVLLKMTEGRLFTVPDFAFWIYALGIFLIPLLVIFFGLCLFYMLAPQKLVRFSRVWIAALYATVLLQVVESLFVIYVKNFASLNVVYGAFGGIMALLLWIYLSGCIFIFGSCLCAAQAETRSEPTKNII